MVPWEALVPIGLAMVTVIAWLAKVGHQSQINERNIAILFDKAASHETKIMDELVRVRENLAEIRGFLESIKKT